MGLTFDAFTLRQTMEDALFECHHYLDRIPPKVEYHEHEFYEIFFFLSGDVSYIIEGSTYQLRPGDILLTNNEDIHKPEVRAGKPYERYVIWIHPDAIQSFHKLGDDLTACFLDADGRRFKLIRPDSGTVTYLKNLCEKIILTRKDNGFAKETLAYLYLCELLVYLNRAYFALPDSIWEDVSENSSVNQVVSYINEHLSEELSLDRLANHFYVSKSYLSHKFKEYTGMTLYQFIIKKRLVVARNMLREGIPVTTVCLQCGFNDYSNFLKQFKREFGRSPREFVGRN